MLKRFLIASGILLAIVAIALYYQLGGSQAIRFKLQTRSGFYITGQFFEGRYNDPALEKLFFRARERAVKDTTRHLTVVNYRTDQQSKIIRQFIGTGSTGRPSRAGDTLEIRVFPPHTTLTTTLKAHNAVMPTADKVLRKARKFAKSKGFVLDSISYEIYFSDRRLEINFPVKSQNPNRPVLNN